MDFLVVLIPLIPLIAAVFIGLDYLFKQKGRDIRDHFADVVVSTAMTLSCAFTIILLISDLLGINNGTYDVGRWLGSENLSINLFFITSGFSVIVAAFFSVILVIVTRFSTFLFI